MLPLFSLPPRPLFLYHRRMAPILETNDIQKTRTAGKTHKTRKTEGGARYPLKQDP